MTVIVDCGSGNLRSVLKAFERFTSPVKVSADPSSIARADRLVLPGQGAFGSLVKLLKEKGLWDPVGEFLTHGRPFLGICVGMQLLFSKSEEKGEHPGFSLFQGKVVRFPEGIKIPQIGWNQVSFEGDSPLYRGIPQGAYFYFVHSYYVAPAGKLSGTVGTTRYGVDYVSALAQGPVAGVQFHPEKSQRWGLKIIENFCNL